jgi:hypothetical protein
MGGGEYNNLKFYMQNTETGEMTEIKGIAEISESQDADSHDIPKINNFSVDMTMTVDLTEREIIQFKRRFFPETLNNYRKLHGMPLMRKRWHG